MPARYRHLPPCPRTLDRDERLAPTIRPDGALGKPKSPSNSCQRRIDSHAPYRGDLRDILAAGKARRRVRTTPKRDIRQPVDETPEDRAPRLPQQSANSGDQ